MQFEDLKGLKGIDRAIEQKEHRIALLLAKPLSTTTNLSGAPGRSGTSDKVGDGAVQIVDRLPMLQHELRQLVRKQSTLTEYIAGIDDCVVQSAVEQYVYLGKTWEQIGSGFHYSESGIRKRVKKYMQTAKRAESAENTVYTVK